MSDNIIDFNKRKQRRKGADESIDFSPEAMLGRMGSMPETALMGSVASAVNDRMMLLMFALDIGSRASEALKNINLDPDEFYLDESSLDRFLSSELAPGVDTQWNGPWFDCDAEGATVRLVTTVSVGEENREGVPIDISMNLLRLDEDAECWQIFTGEDWIEGPPADYFDDDGDWDDEFWDDEDWDDDDEDWDEDDDEDWDEDWDDDSVLNLYLKNTILFALVRGGVETVSQLSDMDDGTLLAIEGISPGDLPRIRRAIADYDLPAGE